MSDDSLRKLASSASARPPRGYRVVVLIGEEKNAIANRIALRMARAYINKDIDHLVLLHCSPDDYSSISAEASILRPYADPAFEDLTSYQVLIKDPEMSTAETIAEYIDATGPDLVIVGSHGLCSSDPRQAPPSRSGGALGALLKLGSAAGGGLLGSKSPRSSFAMRLAQVVRRVPLMVVKANTLGTFLAPSGPHSVRCMVDLQANSRHCLNWLMQRLSAERDTLYLVATKAVDTDGSKLLAERTLTTFNVQCQMHAFGVERRTYKEPPQRALPQAVIAERIDILVVQLPRSKDMGPLVGDLLCDAKTSLLLWPPDYESDISSRNSSGNLSSRPSSGYVAGATAWELAAANAVHEVDGIDVRASAPAVLNGGTGSASRLRRASGAATAYEAALRSQEYLSQASASGSKRAPPPKAANGLHPGAALSASESVMSTRQSLQRPLTPSGYA